MRLSGKQVGRSLFDAAALVVFGIAIFLWPLRLLRRAALPGRVNSLWSGTPIINMATNARAERLLGVNARSLVYFTYFITDAFDYNLSRWASIPLVGRIVPLLVFLWACVFCDRLHFYCDRGLLPGRGHFSFDLRELRIYRLLGIPVLLWTYGADVRSRSVCQAQGEPNCCTECDAPGKYCVCDEQLARKNVAELSRRAVAVFSGMGDMFHYVPGSVNDTYYWPVDLAADGGDRYRPVFPPEDATRPLRIVHAPNHRIFKGTRHVIEAVEALRREGVAVELVLVEGVPNHVAMEIYRTADLVFDQCLMGNYGYFALEAMALGKPVMCFVRRPLEYVLHPEEFPVINTRVGSLKEDILNVVNDRRRLRELGIRGRKYVERHFSLQAFADRLQSAYTRLGVMP
jgi:glycosyltransferase involved in cell wall biosynthesis